MTAGELIARVDELRPNAYSAEQKLRWLRRLDGQILAEIWETHGASAARSAQSEALSSRTSPQAGVAIRTPGETEETDCHAVGRHAHMPPERLNGGAIRGSLPTVRHDSVGEGLAPPVGAGADPTTGGASPAPTETGETVETGYSEFRIPHSELSPVYAADTQLLAPFPWDEGVYTAWLFCQIDLHNGEIGKYTQSLQLLAAAWRSLADWVNRRRMPLASARTWRM